MLLAEPNHLGISTAIAAIDQFIKSSAAGFSDVKVDLKREFREAQRLAQYEDASQGLCCAIQVTAKLPLSPDRLIPQPL
ncbi:hypothetical protein SAMN04488094_1441 [Tropicimonas isoalkanivorans]|uniref:Uncharacterized protein n=2 Tax=Tropicimonas isoalkanivorans TaxID=441112 RepID=A0A1I1RWD0_9RHOB|nr:hypothetical protein SAMN04488094_1441 [Tropicimonas isoalkanivorans]